MSKIEIYDLECFKNFFSYTGMDKETKEVKQFYIYDDYSQIVDIVDHVLSLKGMIGFNNINYDYPLLHYILTNYKDWSIFRMYDILEAIYDESQRIVNADFSSIPYWKVMIPQLDLFKVWHFDNKARMTSLKSIEIAMNFPNVQDMPIEHDHIVQPEDIPSIMDYNLNDVNATFKFYEITVDNGKIQLRKDIQKQYGINCLNFSDVKIGDFINKTVYSELSGREWKEFKDLRTYRPRIKLKDCIPNFIEFKSDIFKNFLQQLRTEEINQTKGGLKFEVIYNGTKYVIAQGGLHSVDKPRWLKSDDEYQLIDADV